MLISAIFFRVHFVWCGDGGAVFAQLNAVTIHLISRPNNWLTQDKVVNPVCNFRPLETSQQPDWASQETMLGLKGLILYKNIGLRWQVCLTFCRKILDMQCVYLKILSTYFSYCFSNFIKRKLELLIKDRPYASTYQKQ